MAERRIGVLGGVAALAIGVGVAAAGIGHLLQSIPTARAAEGIGPTATGGVHPWINLSGVTSDLDLDTVIYTVPADRVLVLTGGCSDSPGASLYEDATLKIDDQLHLLACDNLSSSNDNSPKMLMQGQGHVVFAPGSQVIINNIAVGGWPYYFEGYLAHP
jgi:hypothetical protein